MALQTDRGSSGGEPPLDYSDSLRTAGWAVSIIFTTLATATVGLRFWSRRLTRLGLWWDDWLMLVALVAHIGNTAIICVAIIKGGWGRDVRLVLAEQPDALIWGFKMFIVGMHFNAVSSSTVKLAVLCFYWRLFGRSKSVRYSCYMLGFCCVGCFIAIEIINSLLCRPLAKFWQPELPGVCDVPVVEYLLGYSIANLIIDGLTLLVPVREAWRLRISRRRKVGLVGVFILGSAAFVSCLVRVVLFAQLHGMSVISNPTMQHAPSTIATITEVYAAIIGGCLPTLVPVYRRLRGRDPNNSTYASDSYNKHKSVGQSRSARNNEFELRTIGQSSGRQRRSRHPHEADAGSFETLPGEEAYVLPVLPNPVETRGGLWSEDIMREEQSGLCSVGHHAFASSSKKSDSSLRTDEIPLHSGRIKVTRDVELMAEERRRKEAPIWGSTRDVPTTPL